MRKPYQVRPATLSPNANGKSGHCQCVQCGQLATKEALLKSGRAIVVEKYCDACLQTEKFTAIMTFYSSTGD